MNQVSKSSSIRNASERVRSLKFYFALEVRSERRNLSFQIIFQKIQDFQENVKNVAFECFEEIMI